MQISCSQFRDLDLDVHFNNQRHVSSSCWLTFECYPIGEDPICGTKALTIIDLKT